MRKDPLVTDLQSTSLKPLRHKLAFHFDPQEVGRQLSQITRLEPVFASGTGKENLGVNYDLADLCAMGVLLGSDLNAEDATNKLISVLDRTSKLAVHFTNQSETFIVAKLEKSGWQII